MEEIRKDNTEEKILEAARTVFTKKGMDGARMQEIADEAGINKALLHYYFRSKQKLFEAIFSHVFKQIFPDIRSFIQAQKPIEEKIKIFSARYMELLMLNPYLPAFLLRELQRDPEFLASVIKSQGVNPGELLTMLKAEMRSGQIKNMDPRELLINLLSLIIFPVAAGPLLQIMFFGDDPDAYNEFLTRRKETITTFILHSILVK